ncbi:uncharacterized protein LOC119911488 isoform X1 [Micropterus salmoides]|uniref:uncharacterized protein LOC119911488 isoform X1 n=1 Tax=Micropterus salmoides TaxID=27706 RepID=UPI0018EBAAEA|nr:uncharacterized protein LOC119911488 isoform X1 [Micropterus salmoides]
MVSSFKVEIFVRCRVTMLDVKMGHTLFCVLGLFLWNTLLHSVHAEEDKTKPVLTVSPSWLSPGASVTLSCRVKDPSAGWRFFWYKAVPKQSGNSYDQELLPGSSDGTEQDSYVVHGQTHTAGYKCRAGRGDPVYYTYYSEPKFVWSGDFHPATVRVSPDREQHFSSEPVSLSCEGNSSKWRVRRFTKAGHLSNCSKWGTMTGSTCSINELPNNTAVYWCESESAQFSNAVNITVQTAPEDSSFLLPLIVGPVCGILLIILLLLLCCYRKSKDSYFTRTPQTQRTNKGSAPDQVVYQNETTVHSSHLHGDACLSESIRGSENTENDADESSYVTYSLIQLKHSSNKGQHNEPEESSLYSNVKTRSAAGRSSPAATDETVYSEVKIGTALGNNAPM